VSLRVVSGHRRERLRFRQVRAVDVPSTPRPVKGIHPRVGEDPVVPAARRVQQVGRPSCQHEAVELRQVVGGRCAEEEPRRLRGQQVVPGVVVVEQRRAFRMEDHVGVEQRAEVAAQGDPQPESRSDSGVMFSSRMGRSNHVKESILGPADRAVDARAYGDAAVAAARGGRAGSARGGTPRRRCDSLQGSTVGDHPDSGRLGRRRPR